MPIEWISPKLENIYLICASLRLGERFSTVIEVNFTLSCEDEESDELDDEELEEDTLGINWSYYKNRINKAALQQ